MTTENQNTDSAETTTEAAEEQKQFNATSGRLRSFIERVERLEEEKQGLTDDIKEVWGEAKGEGFQIDVLKKIVAMRKKDPADLAEYEAILDTYKSALGME